MKHGAEGKKKKLCVHTTFLGRQVGTHPAEQTSQKWCLLGAPPLSDMNRTHAKQNPQIKRNTNCITKIDPTTVLPAFSQELLIDAGRG